MAQMDTLMEWFSTIDFLKHIRKEQIPRVFSDGVLFFLLLEELFNDEELPQRNVIRRKLEATDKPRKKLENWKILNQCVLKKLKLSRTDWFMEFIVRENPAYIEDVLLSLREIAVNHRQGTSWAVPRERITVDRVGRRRDQETLASFIPLRHEPVIWGWESRASRRRFENDVKQEFDGGVRKNRYFNTGGQPEYSPFYNGARRSGIQTYCLKQKDRQKRGSGRRSRGRRHFEDWRQPPRRVWYGYDRYVYKYYHQFPLNCSFCKSHLQDCYCPDDKEYYSTGRKYKREV